MLQRRRPHLRLLLAAFVLFVAACGSDGAASNQASENAGEQTDATAIGGDESDGEASDSDGEPTDGQEPPAEETTEETVAEAAPTGATECPPADGSAERIVAFGPNPPPLCIDVNATYQAVITTNRGEFTVDLNATLSPQTVNNFVVLARYHYYDGVSFHRIIPGFVVQGGDPVGQPVGTGGPGYVFADELDFDGYEVGSIAMANAGPNTNGSQFFVVTGENGAQLPPLYSLFGTVSEGMDVVMAIEGTGTDSGQPTEPTIMESVVIIES